MSKILYTSFLFLSLLIFLVSCNNSNKLKNANDEIVGEKDTISTQTSAANLDESIIGTYKFQENSDSKTSCDLSLEISGTAGNYQYLLRNSKEDRKGALKFEDSKVPGEKIAVLEELKYDIYEGDPNSSGAISTTPAAVSAIYKDNSFQIQNIGNNMNSFTVFNDCTAEYINLVKQ